MIGVDCEKSIGGLDQAGPHMTTATVVRDMISILDAFAKTEDGECSKDPSLLNYWGISYGTYIGQTFASMFPDRLGRVVLGGVLDADDYAPGLWPTSLQLTDDAFSTFFLYCNVASPSKCSFYTGTGPLDIYLRFEAILSKLNATEAEKQNQLSADAIELVLSVLRSSIFSATYGPLPDFPTVAEFLVQTEALLPNLRMETFPELLDVFIPGNVTADISPLVWKRAVACPDNGGKLSGRAPQDLANEIQMVKNQSYLGASIMTMESWFACTGWPITSDYIYLGVLPT
jgi:pimeloyl-ACP methyl ester carboxylesterase